MVEPVVAAEKAELTPKESDDAFAAAFDQISAFDNQSAEPVKPAEVQKAADPAAKPAEPAESAGEKPDAAAQEDDPIAAAALAAVEPAAKPAEPRLTKPADALSDDDMLRRLSGMLRKADPTPAAAPAPAPAAAEPPKSPFTPEETTIVEAYMNDFPDVARAESLIRRSEYQAVAGYIFAEVSRELQPLVQMVRTLSERTHLGDLQASVPDYATLRDQVIDWVGKQPPYLKSAYENVVKQGTAADVTDLITRFRKETGAAAPAPVAAAAKPATELPDAAKKAVAALAPVTSKRSAAPVTAVENTNYEDAFAAFAKELA